MSRVEKHKAIKRAKRNKLKTTMVCLALTLILGFTQALETYALFTDSVNGLDNVSISLGDLAVSATEGFKDVLISKEQKLISKNFEIKNDGTLKQSLSVQLKPHITDEINESVLKNISYTLESTDKKFEPITTNLYDLKDSNVNIKNPSGKDDLILPPGETLKCKATISISKEDTLKSLSGKSVKFDLNIRGQQVNWSEKGFYDVFTQENTFKKELGENQTEGDFDYCPCSRCQNISTGKRSKAFRIDTSNVVPDGVKVSTAGVDGQWTSNGQEPQTGKDYSLHVTDKGYLYFVQTNGATPTVKEILDRTLQLQLNLSNGSNLFFIVTFTEGGKDLVIANWQQIPNPYRPEVPTLPTVSTLPEVPKVPTESEKPESSKEPTVPTEPETSENIDLISPKEDEETTQ